jgi:hypothetical protein
VHLIQPPLIENQISGESSKIVDESLRKQKRNTGKRLLLQRKWSIMDMVMDTGILINTTAVIILIIIPIVKIVIRMVVE